MRFEMEVEDGNVYMNRKGTFVELVVRDEAIHLTKSEAKKVSNALKMLAKK